MKDLIVQAGAPILRQVAKPVARKDFDSRRLHTLILKMGRLLDAEEFGVAIAAPQVGVSERLFLVAGKVFEKQNPEKEKSESPKGGPRTFPFPDSAHRVFINPEIIRLSRKKAEMSEGCLSVRGKYGSVIRHERASVKAQDEQGKIFTYHGTGLLAQIFQHECDHLDGILYTDKAEHIRDEAKKEKND